MHKALLIAGSLGVGLVTAAFAEPVSVSMPKGEVASDASVALNRLATNKLAANKLAANKLAANKLAANKLASNRLAINRLATNSVIDNAALPGDMTFAATGPGDVTPVLTIVAVSLADGSQLDLSKAP